MKDRAKRAAAYAANHKPTREQRKAAHKRIENAQRASVERHLAEQARTRVDGMGRLFRPGS